MSSIIDLLKYAKENNSLNFASTVDNILGQKAIEMLDIAKEGLAKNMFNQQTSDNVEQEENDLDLESDDVVNDDQNIDLED